MIQMTIWAGLLFLPAGTFDWWRAWLLIGIMFLGFLASAASLFPGHKDLLAERVKSPLQKGQPLADKIVLTLLLISFYGLIAFIPMDVFRFHLMAGPGILASSLGLVLFLSGWRIAFLALRENAFASPVVKLQEERVQKVIDTGVYGVVRHPLYAGGILFIVGIPLWLGSYAGVALSVVPIGALVLRVIIEERFLRRQLKGYEAYMKRVCYRLIPFLW
ncbi:MAG: isoprenylcysteine carboxylmethyltransferase family protein [Candidatus Sulfobium sp.]|jgi:protein-S-isoprenylcysteine O-methyltransferase Ste14